MIRFIIKLINKINNLNDCKAKISVCRNTTVSALQLVGKVTINSKFKIVNAVFLANISIGV